MTAATVETLKNFRPGKRDNGVHDPVRRANSLARCAQEDLFMNGIQSDAGCHVSSELLNRNFNLRVVHSVGHQNFFTLAVISQGLGLAESK